METHTKIAIAVGVGALILFSRRSRASDGGRMTRSNTGSAGTKSVETLAQGDPRWGGFLVGNTTDRTKTYANVGCVTTAITAALNALRGTRFTPADLRPGAAAGLNSSHYQGASIISDTAAPALGLVIAGRIAPALSNRSAQGLANMRAAIERALAGGGLALVRVDYDLTTADANHTVVCFARDPTGYLCMDPAGGKRITLSFDGLFTQRTPTKTYAAVGVAPIFLSGTRDDVAKNHGTMGA